MPARNWIMAKDGSKQVPVVGNDDIREITILLAVIPEKNCSMSR